MEFRVLGELEVERNGDLVDTGAYRQRALLALLLTAPGSVFSTDAIIDSLWGETGGSDRQNSVWVYISGLRKALDPDREKRSDGTVLLTRSPGYLLSVDADQIDAVRFERQVSEGRLLTDADPAAASIVLGEALGLWRGRPYEAFTYESFAQPEIARLSELRLEAVEARLDADLRRGLTRELISELESLVRAHPLREAFTGQLMTALYRSGRRADALRAFQHLSTRLGEELGIEPTAPVRRLESAIVTGEAATTAPAPITVSGPQPGLAVRGYELRELLTTSVAGDVYRAYQPAMGREVAVTVISAELADDPDQIRRFEADAQIVASIDSPHLVPLYDFWREPGAAYLVTRLLPGGDLASRLEQGALTPAEAAHSLTQLGDALAAAHRAGITHHHVTTSDVLLDDDGNAYLAGLGRMSRDNTEDRRPDVVGLATVAAQMLTGLEGDLEQIRGALAPAVRDTLADCLADPVDVAALTATLRDVLTNGAAINATVETVDLDNPYKGLRAFTAADTDDFWGRERLVERLVNRIAHPGRSGRFIAIVGPSGSGKSSVARAGLLPALRDGAAPDSRRWFTTEMTPAPHPFEALEDALLAIAVDPPVSMVETLLEPAGIQRALNRILPDDGSNVVLVIDQFEELFTQVEPSTAADFIDSLTEVIEEAHGRLRVVVTLRADFYDRPLRHPALGELLRDGTEVITAMTPDELERAITGPISGLPIEFETGLVAELVHDVIDRDGALPLLQYTLTELFDGQVGGQITSDVYRSLGGVSGALVARANGLLTRLGDDATDATRQIFLRLVTLGEGAGDTRRRVLRTELDQLPIDGRTLEGILETFGRHRLLSFDRDPVTRSPTVEISHEALLAEWAVLREWVDAARHDVRHQRRLAESMQEWIDSDRRADYLLRGGRLEQLRGWSTSTTLSLAEEEQAFLDASVAERDRAAAGERKREQRAAEAEAAATQRSRQLRIASGVAVVVAILAVFGLSQWLAADDARATAEDEREAAEGARAVADEARIAADEARIAAEQAQSDRDALATATAYVKASETTFGPDPERSLLYAVEAIRATTDLGFATEEAVDRVHWALQRLGVRFDLGPDPRTTIRSGPYGVTGLYLLSPAALVALADDTTARQLTTEECVAATEQPCLPGREIPAELPLQFGEARYRADVPQILAADSQLELSGTTVTVVPNDSSSIDGLIAEFDRFTQATGIRIDVLRSDVAVSEFSVSEVISEPDVRIGFSPSTPPTVMDLSTFIDIDRFRADYGDYLTELLSTVGPNGPELRQVPVNLGPRAVVAYAKPAFEAAGFEVPATFDELVSISEQIVANGDTPWCFRWEAGLFTGFFGTDLLESLTLHTAGTAFYDRWAKGDAGFTSDAVLEAARQSERLLFGDGFVDGGSSGITSRFFGDGLVQLLDGPTGPACSFTLISSSDINRLGTTSATSPLGVLGRDIGLFMMPPIDGPSNAMIGGGTMASASNDRPEVRALMRFIASPVFGEAWAGSERNGQEAFTASNQRFDTETFLAGALPEEAATRIAVNEAQLVALRDGTWRFEANGLMDPSFGVLAGSSGLGSQATFLRGMTDWANQVAPIEEIFVRLDEERARLATADD
ncbi:MAG: extracellular solute-binding protein [Actinomycetota bacterium]